MHGPMSAKGPVRIEIAADGAVNVALHGSIILIRTNDILGQIDRALKESTSALVRVDLAQATSLDSSGVALIVLGRRLAHRRGAVFALVNPRPTILAHLNMTGVAQLLGMNPPAPETTPERAELLSPAGPNAATGTVEILAAEFNETSLEPLRHRLAAYAATCGLGELDRYKFVLAVTEILTNAVRHGGGRGRIRAWQQGFHLGVEISDFGPGFRRPNRRERVRPRAGHVDPWGLWLVRQICETVDIDTGPGGTTVRLSYALPRVNGE